MTIMASAQRPKDVVGLGYQTHFFCQTVREGVEGRVGGGKRSYVDLINLHASVLLCLVDRAAIKVDAIVIE